MASWCPFRRGSNENDGATFASSCSPLVVLSRQGDARPELCQAADRTLVLHFDADSDQGMSDQRGSLGAQVQRGGQDLAMVMFTSGSTGLPKGVMLSHRNLLSNRARFSASLPIREDDRALVVLPFYHAFGNSVLQTHLLAGATLVLEGSLVIPATVIQALLRTPSHQSVGCSRSLFDAPALCALATR